MSKLQQYRNELRNKDAYALAIRKLSMLNATRINKSHSENVKHLIVLYPQYGVFKDELLEWGTTPAQFNTDMRKN